MRSLDTALDPLRERAQKLLARSHVPFSDAPAAAVLLLDDGSWIPGVRVESAAFSLTLPALLNAYTTAVAADRAEAVVGMVLSRAFRPEERVYVQGLPHGPYVAAAEDTFVRDGLQSDGGIPSIDALLPPALEDSVESTDEGVDHARRIAERAYVPASEYPVGAVLELDDERLIPGVNVEHPDWARILCAERNALGTVLSYGLAGPHRLFLTCDADPEGTPCGACRQLLAELAPNTILWMDRRNAPPERTTVSALLPGSFRGRNLPTRRDHS